MSILDAMKMVKDSGFNAGDAINTSTGLGSGIYPVRIKQAERSEFKGYERANIILEVVSGEAKDRLEFLELNFSDNLPDFVIEKNGKILLTLIDILGVNPTKSQLADPEGLVEYFQSQIGKQFKMDLKLRQNKKNPQYPYRDYEFDRLEDSPFGAAEGDTDDFPF
ncbi:hypothetical protein HYO62_00310 [Aerococcaceae bacterium DSM 111022]|nr:hypothetical protein [Aerococcaceae bacterium DSM 111022]